MPSDDVNREPKAGRMDGSDRAFEDGGVDSDFNQRGNFRGGRMFRRGNPPSRRTVVLGDEQMPLEEFEGADIMTTNPGWIQSGIAAAEIPQPTVDNSLATSASTIAIPTSPASTIAIPTSPASTLAIPTSPASILAIPTPPASTIAIPTSPASTLAIPTSPASTLAIPTPPASTLAIATPPASTLAIPTSPAPTLAIPNPGGNKRKKKNAPTHPIATPPASTLVIATPPAPTVAVPTFPASALAIPTPPAPTVAIPTPPAPTLAIPTPGGNKRKKKKNDRSHSTQDVYKGDVLKERVREVGQALQ
ncbi:mucin-19-like isoform X1 [Labeo rohita]|uniref:Mucin-19-like isoform X1 n=1 Tax=Labeo rohita TaxID=84645 RepID=A0A498N673_LABRO|nr:mucin-19-like isoform X1 [Labeo rohita]